MSKAKLTDIAALVDRAIEHNVIVKGGGGWLSFGDDKLGQGTEKAAAHLADNAELLAKIETATPAAPEGQETKPPAAAKPTRKARGPLREIPVLSPLRHDGKEYGPDDKVELHRDDFLTLKGLLVVEGEWPAD